MKRSRVLARIRNLLARGIDPAGPCDAWHSFDRHPWRHPWLTPDNLRDMAAFSRGILLEARRIRDSLPRKANRYGFACNIANSMYSTAKALWPLGANIDVILHPSDHFLMSQPEWEEFGGVVKPGVSTLDEATSIGIEFPHIEHVVRPGVLDYTPQFNEVADFATRRKFDAWRSYYAHLPTIRALREYDALFIIQAPYLAYLSERPYIATHMGGDIWYECSRDDLLGRLQRAAFANANLLIASNPWSFAFARRYGFRNLVCMPTLLNPDDYSPGNPDFRDEWMRETDGDFIVLTTARVDDLFKGSNLALRGFQIFSEKHARARLALIGWGADVERHSGRIRELGLAGKVIWLPPAGKRRLIRYLRSAHVLLDQFVLGYFGMTALEAIAVGTPVVMRLEEAQYSDFLDAGPPPVLNSSDEAEIASALTALCASKDFLKLAGERNRRWFMRYSGDMAIRERYLDLLTVTAAGYRFDYSRSPLQSRISSSEMEYHAEQLRNAPVFPNYF